MSTIQALTLVRGYNRLTTQIADAAVENEDLVNLPNWLPLALRIDGGDWLRPDAVEYLDYRQELERFRVAWAHQF